MKLHSWYNFLFSSQPYVKLNLPFELVLPYGTVYLNAFHSNNMTAEVMVVVGIDVEGLSLADHHEILGGSPMEGGIDVPERSITSELAVTASRILSFLFGSNIRLTATLGRDKLVPESLQDQQALEALGNRKIDVRLTMDVDVKPSIVFKTFDVNVIQVLIERESGLALYYDAIELQSSIAQYREIWKMLEAAFAAKNNSLVALISKYPPAQQIGFGIPELKELLVLRGRASHADSRAGLSEYKQVARLTKSKVRRLKSLAEQILVTKKTWGDRSLEHNRIADLRAFFDQSGRLKIIIDKDPIVEKNNK